MTIKTIAELKEYFQNDRRMRTFVGKELTFQQKMINLIDTIEYLTSIETSAGIDSGAATNGQIPRADGAGGAVFEDFPQNLFYTCLIAQAGVAAPVIYDEYTNITGIVMTPSRDGVGDYRLLPDIDFINNSVITKIEFRQYYDVAPGHVVAQIQGGLPRNSIDVKAYNPSFALADGILGGVLYIEILNNAP